MRIPSLFGALTVCAISPLAAQVPPPQQQIDVAVSAAPEPDRPTATVLGYSNYHRLTTLREGSGDLICLADDPAVSSWHVACYHKDLEPFMALGRQLEAAGMSRQAIDSIRLAAIKAGSIKMPDGPRALYNLYARKDSVDAATGQARNPMALQVVYIPYATEESTGIPTEPGGGLPWLMYPGMPWAHIMIMREDH